MPVDQYSPMTTTLCDARDSGIRDINDATVWQLVQRAQDGRAGAFDQLYRLHFDCVRAFVYSLVKDKDLADDFTSETFLRAYRSINSVTFRGVPVRAWLMTIAKNIVRDYVKSAYRRTEFCPLDNESTDRVSTDDPELETLHNFVAVELRRCLEELPATQRECLTLRFLDGLSVQETANQMGKKNPAIRQLQYRAVQSLAAIMRSSWLLSY